MAQKNIFLNCEKCGFSTEWDFSLASHVKNSHRLVRETGFDCNLAFIEQFVCADWGYDTFMKVDLDIHVRSGHNWDNPEFIHEIQEDFRPDQWECPKCDFKTFTNLLSYTHNCKQDNLLEPKMESITITGVRTKISFKPWLYCGHCSYKSLRKAALRSHIMNRHLPKTELFKCDQCSFETGYKHSINSHVTCKHKSSDEIEWFSCDLCDYKGKDKIALRRHLNNKHKSRDEIRIKWFSCDQCSYKSKQTSHLKRHIKSKHSSTRKTLADSDLLHCAHCDFKTPHNGNLKRHVNSMHTSDDKAKWFPCDQCTYKSKFANGLRSHLKYHHLKPEDVKWFYCGHCNYKSKAKGNLKQHMDAKHFEKQLK